MSISLSMKDVSLTVGGARILHAIECDVEAGQILGIAGRNGAGKSSLLRLACAEREPDTGSITLEGRKLSTLQARERARRIAMLPQTSTLQFNFDVREIVELGFAPHDSHHDNRPSTIAWALSACDLEAHAKRSYLTLSGGEQQRVHMARVLVQCSPQGGDGDLRGQVLLLDEPTSAMDLPHQERCVALLRHLAERGCAVLLVVHDINLLARSVDRLLFLNEGTVQAQGPVSDLLNEDQLSRLYDHPVKLLRTEQAHAPVIQALPYED